MNLESPQIEWCYAFMIFFIDKPSRDEDEDMYSCAKHIFNNKNTFMIYLNSERSMTF